ncbi:Pectic enzymes secretion protein outO [Chromobacterium violaceum]|uniref:Pectic enzymes secretion protein outO n=1 Tax=Chromobacterium violaceum TaxID=536 RepID=A0A3S4K0S9_CHRVL|nr:Pectic enzymes secretion protein outO [Chromobacterium violaceum]
MEAGWGWPLAGALALTAVLLALAFIDFDTKLLPDGLTLPLLWGGLLFNLMTGLVPLSAAVLGAVYGYMTLWLVSHAYKLVAGRHGMGAAISSCWRRWAPGWDGPCCR